MEKYILFNCNTEVLSFDYDNDLNYITNINKIYNLDYAPVNIKNVETEKRLIELNNWFNDRGIPPYRDNVKDILEVFNISNVKELIKRDYALSLSDQYWIKEENSNVEWKNINYFDKDYDSVMFADASYGSGAGNYLNQTKTNTSDKTPNNTSNGQLRKVWIQKNKENYLYKGAGTIHNCEPINEVLATKICEILDVPHAEYTIDIIQSQRQNTLVSVCPCFIQKNEEIIPAYSVLTQRKNEIKKDITDYNIYLEILKSYNVLNAEEYLQKMLMLDYILLNEDRHLGNFGAIRDVETLEWTRICPIFDTGRSMNTNVTTSYWNFEEGEIKCFSTELISCTKLEDIFTIKLSDEQIEKLKDLKKVYRQMLIDYRMYTKLSNEEIEMLSNGYENRIAIFEKLIKN